LAETPKEFWIQLVALTTTILAGAAAIASLWASGYSTQLKISATKEANLWSYYQAKNMTETNYQVNRDILQSLRMITADNPKAQKFLTAQLADYNQEINRYANDKQKVKAQAETLVKRQEVCQAKGGELSLAVKLLQIAIMCSGIGALINRKIMWYVGLGFGAWGLVYMGLGFLA
jgi:hypothetical protein